jgi:sphingolipid delta-4 desaturase
MGKGGNATAAPVKSLSAISKDDAASILKNEREQKMNLAPKFYWADESTLEEPHVARRKAITKAHPEIKKLFGPDHKTKYTVLASMLLQVFSLHLLQGAAWYTWLFCCYTLSGTINHMLTLAMHEAAHGLTAKGVTRNRIIGIFANLSMGIPASASFKRYHMEHHRFQGEDIMDVDIPCDLEGWFFRTTARKVLWCFLQPAFYSLRPMYVNPKAPTKWEFINYACTVVFDATIVYFFGISGLAYLAFGTLLGMGIHPVAGHFISEHYVMAKDQETYSYYGPLNWFTFHVGYHNEHHDFPFVTGKNLAKVRAIAPEFYDDIPHYHSWSKVIWDYIVDEKISPYSRVKRVGLTNEEIEDLRKRGGLVK